MTTKYAELTSKISEYVGKITQELPEVMQGFRMMHKDANKEGALSNKTKELIALAIGISSQCDGCIGMHMKALIKLGVTREEILETLSVAIYMGGGPTLMYAANALKAFEELSGTDGKTL